LRDQARHHKTGKRASGPTTSLDELRELESPSNTPVQALSDSNDLEQVEDALDKLPKEWRDVFLMRHYMGFSFKQIANRLPDHTPNAVRMIYRRARVKLISEVRHGEQE